jgi:hypothetical protein
MCLIGFHSKVVLAKSEGVHSALEDGEDRWQSTLRTHSKNERSRRGMVQNMAIPFPLR